MSASAPAPDQDRGAGLRRELRFWEAIACRSRSWRPPRLFSGWALLGTYLAFTAASTAEAGLFGVAFFQTSGIWDDAEWLVIALVAGVLIALIAYGDIRVATRSLLGLDGVSVALIVILVVIIVVKLIAGSPPGDQGITADIFDVPSGTSLDTVATGRVRVPLVRRLRGRGLARRGDRRSQAPKPQVWAMMTTMYRRGGREGVHGDGRLAHPLRNGARRLRVAPPGRGVATHGRAGGRVGRGDGDRAHRGGHPADRRHPRQPTRASTPARSGC
jgi:hypothetical protein